jgi:hypothetical protein
MASEKSKQVKLLSAAVGGGALVVMGVMGIATGQHPGIAGSATVAKSSNMTVGATSTNTTPSTAPGTGVARPAITGPAALPSEEAAAK